MKIISIFGRLAILAMFLVAISLQAVKAERTQLVQVPAPGGELYAEAPSQEVLAEKKAMREEVLFFEPDEYTASKNWQAIQAQDKLYRKARSEKNWGEARRLALFHFTKAWLWFNQAMSIVNDKEGWTDITQLKEALTNLQNAEEALRSAKAEKHHKKEWSDCAKKTARVRASVEKQISDILSK